MQAFQNIQLAFKCPRALDELQPCQSNWYCDGCRKMVYDFRGMEEAQILKAFAQSGQKLCGIYDSDRIKVLPQKPLWFRIASINVMALGLALLNSCGFGYGDKTNMHMGKAIVKKSAKNTLMSTPLPALKSDTSKPDKIIGKLRTKVRFPPPVVMGDVEVRVEPSQIDSITGNTAFVGMAMEVGPSYPGGETAFTKYLQEHVKNPSGFRGRALAQFMIERDGSASEIKILRSAGAETDTAIVQTLKQMPHWRPGIQNSKPYPVQYTIPVNFSVEEK